MPNEGTMDDQEGKRVRDVLMQAETVNAGNYYTKFTSFYSLKM